jgi:peptide-methionine (S)-S-oxide reductase
VGTYVGYTGGKKRDPTYRDMLDHTEAIFIEFDPTIITYDELLKEWSSMHMPNYKNKCQYRSAVWYLTRDQMKAAKAAVGGMKAASGEELYTSVEPATKFYKGEEYHQKFVAKQVHGEIKSKVRDKASDSSDYEIYL